MSNNHDKINKSDNKDDTKGDDRPPSTSKNMINDMEKCMSNTTCIKWHILQLICPYWKYKTINI